MSLCLCPKKYLIKDLINRQLPLDVWIQGTIQQTVGTDILIISDSSGKAKITKCDAADGIINKKTLCRGTLLSSKGLPEIQASKFVDLSSNPHMKSSWDIEVQEASLFLEGKIIPTI